VIFFKEIRAMSRVICLLLFLGLPSAFAGAENDPSAKDLEAMQGDWAVIEYVVDGIKSEDDNAQSLFRTIKGNHYTVFLFEAAGERHHQA
jgi:hypothetical protein